MQGLPPDQTQWTKEEYGRWLLAQMLEWHRREEKSSWWEYFRLCELWDTELQEDKSALGGMQYLGVSRQESSRESSIKLKPGVMFCFRRFHELITDLVRAAWIRYIRRLNSPVLGASNDLDQFLFGAERAALGKYLPILYEVQEGRCLYCERKVERGSVHIDHFIPWSRYPIDLGHNFVLADVILDKQEALTPDERKKYLERSE